MSGLPTLVLASLKDEAVPSHVDIEGLARKLAAAMGPSAQVAALPGASHAADGHEEQLVQQVLAFVQKLDGVAA
jgi:alpha-beta hydrolase superfamily lysophospholipase